MINFLIVPILVVMFWGITQYKEAVHAIEVSEERIK